MDIIDRIKEYFNHVNAVTQIITSENIEKINSYIKLNSTKIEEVNKYLIAHLEIKRT